MNKVYYVVCLVSRATKTGKLRKRQVGAIIQVLDDGVANTQTLAANLAREYWSEGGFTVHGVSSCDLQTGGFTIPAGPKF